MEVFLSMDFLFALSAEPFLQHLDKLINVKRLCNVFVHA